MNRFIGIVVFFLASAVFGRMAWAGNVVDVAVLQGQSFGQQSDASLGLAYSQSFYAPSGTILHGIRWWGFHGSDSLGGSYDNFVVSLGSKVQTGVLTVKHLAFFEEYTLTFENTELKASTLSIFNDSSDVEWYWQSAAAEGNPSAPDANAVAFSLISAVPEPSTLPFIVVGMAFLFFVVNRNLKSKNRHL